MSCHQHYIMGVSFGEATHLFLDHVTLPLSSGPCSRVRPVSSRCHCRCVRFMDITGRWVLPECLIQFRFSFFSFFGIRAKGKLLRVSKVSVLRLEKQHFNSISHLSCSLTRNIKSHSMKNLAFHSLMTEIVVLPILIISLIRYKWWESVLSCRRSWQRQQTVLLPQPRFFQLLKWSLQLNTMLALHVSWGGEGGGRWGEGGSRGVCFGRTRAQQHLVRLTRMFLSRFCTRTNY